MIKDQIITENYAAYNGDCMHVLPTLENESIHLVVYSPPFAGLYNYSSHENDFSNCESKEQFLQQYEFLVTELSRVTMKGRINAVHVTEVIQNNGQSWDFPGEVIKMHERNGFDYAGRITVWKEPLKVRMRTMVKSLMHKLIVEDATKCFPAQPDYILLFRKRGENPVPVEHPFGMFNYAGATPLLPAHLGTYGLPIADFDFSSDFGDGLEAYSWASFKALQRKYRDHQDPKTNKCSHIVWQRYASSVWDDIRIDNVLPFRDGKDEDDEKHVHPLQLDVIDRVVELWSNPGEIVLTPFAGVGSEGYSPVSLKRKAIMIELKESYFKQLGLNMKEAIARFKENVQAELF